MKENEVLDLFKEYIKNSNGAEVNNAIRYLLFKGGKCKAKVDYKESRKIQHTVIVNCISPLFESIKESRTSSAQLRRLGIDFSLPTEELLKITEFLLENFCYHAIPEILLESGITYVEYSKKTNEALLHWVDYEVVDKHITGMPTDAKFRIAIAYQAILLWATAQAPKHEVILPPAEVLYSRLDSWAKGSQRSDNDRQNNIASIPLKDLSDYKKGFLELEGTPRAWLAVLSKLMHQLKNKKEYPNTRNGGALSDNMSYVRDAIDQLDSFLSADHKSLLNNATTEFNEYIANNDAGSCLGCDARGGTPRGDPERVCRYWMWGKDFYETLNIIVRKNELTETQYLYAMSVLPSPAPLGRHKKRTEDNEAGYIHVPMLFSELTKFTKFAYAQNFPVITPIKSALERGYPVEGEPKFLALFNYINNLISGEK